jgi:hypothetical protein
MFGRTQAQAAGAQIQRAIATRGQFQDLPLRQLVAKKMKFMCCHDLSIKSNSY